MIEIKVRLPAAPYDIVIEEQLGETFVDRLRRFSFSRRALVVTDANLAGMYGDLVLQLLERAGYEGFLFALTPGETAKSLAAAETLYTKAIEWKLDRQSPFIALGGGVVGDLTGFAAATYLRGVPLIQIPTSLLAQVDSSVGGKVAVNHVLGKNLIGAFYQPKFVMIATGFLKTLPEREIHTGLAEIIKYGVIRDASFFDWLEKARPRVLALDDAALTHMARRSCEIKAAVVEADEKETGRRVILNFGHTIAHAIETATGYVRYNHGEAVAVGMYGAALLSRAAGLAGAATPEAIAAVLHAFGLPLTVDCKPEELFDLLHRDKKTIGGKINWVLTEAVGKVTVRDDVPDALVRRVLAEIATRR